MFEAIISNTNTGQVHRQVLETHEEARQYASDWLAMKRDRAEARAFARGNICRFSERSYRIEIEFVETGDTLLAVGSAAESARETQKTAAA